MWLQLTFQADRERQEAEEMQKEMGLGEEDDSLVMMLKVHTHMYEIVKGLFVCFSLSNHPFILIFQQKQKSREQNFNGFLSDLEAKYAKKSGAKKGKRGKKWEAYRLWL